MSDANKLTDLIQQAASSITMASDSDLSEVNDLQSLLDEIGQCIDDISKLPEDIRHKAVEAASNAGELIGEVLEQESDNAAESLKVVSDTIVAIQQLSDSIAKGVNPEEISMDLPGGEAAQQAVEVEEAVVESAEEVAEDAFVVSEDDVELVSDFIAESAEHIESSEAGLLTLESNPDDSEAINLIFRGFHTIKGMAGFLNIAEIGSLAHAAENLLDLGRKGQLELVGPNMDVVFESIDMLKVLMDSLKEAVEDSGVMGSNPGLPELLEKLKACANGEAVETVKAPEPAAVEPEAKAEVAEVEAAEPEAVVEAAEKEEAKAEVAQQAVEEAKPEAVEAKVTEPVEKPAAEVKAEQKVAAKAAPAAQPATAAKPKTPAASKGKPKQAATEEKIKVGTSRLDNLVNMVGELVIAQSMVSQEATASLSPDHTLCRQVSHQGKIVRELQELSMMMRMVPIQGVFQKMARLVRDLCQKSGKKVEFSTEGEETELDRIVVDQIADPLVHMIRNSVDHGIESAEDRAAAGKTENGKVSLRAFHQAGSIVIEIEDNGKGLDKDKILQKAIDNGVVAAGTDMSDSEIFKLIFHAGLSTAAKITEVSGRGVGMDVVKKNIESLRGKIDIESTPGQGTVFTIRLPLTMAIIEGQLVRIGNSHYIVPIVSIETCLRPTESQINTVQGRGEVVDVHGQLVPMVRLYKLFGVEPDTDKASESSIVVVEEDGKKGSLLVDELLGQYQVVIKSLGEGIGLVKGISGAAIMGDGRVRLILDIPGLLEIAHES